MTAFYNEIDPFAAQWLRNLIKAGQIAPGIVDERSIEDIKPSDLSGFTQCHFFAGVGVWSLALRRAGWDDSRPVWTGSCPCQPFSAAGKGGGFADERHLWPDFHWLIKQCKPSKILGEQVAGKPGAKWIDLVSSDLEGIGYSFGAAVTTAAGTGAAHIRERLYWFADTSKLGNKRQVSASRIGEARQRGAYSSMDMQQIIDSPFLPGRCYPKPLLCSGDDGLASRVGRMHAYGNAIHASQAQVFIESVMECMP